MILKLEILLLFIGAFLYQTLARRIFWFPFYIEEESADCSHFQEAIFELIAKAQPNSNVLISQFAIGANLMMIYYGANGTTAREISNLLTRTNTQNTPFAIEQTMSYMDAVQQQLAQVESVEARRSMFGLFVDKKFRLAPAYNKTLQTEMHAYVNSVDFSQQANAVKQINYWVQERTRNAIRDMLTPQTRVQDTDLLALSAYRVRGHWSRRFNKALTRKTPFTTYNGARVSVNMMLTHGTFKYTILKTLDAVAIDLPYGNGLTSMFIALPNKFSGLRTLEQGIARMGLRSLLPKMKMENVTVFLPQFSINFEVDLPHILQQLGVVSAFQANASFPLMFANGERTKLSLIKHKALVNVMEDGTKMGQASYIQDKPARTKREAIGAFEAKLKFYADHPFYFAIHKSGFVIASGHLQKP